MDGAFDDDAARERERETRAGAPAVRFDVETRGMGTTRACGSAGGRRMSAPGSRTSGRKRRRSELGPLGTMGDLKTTPMQTPVTRSMGLDGCDGFNIIAKRTSTSGGAARATGGRGTESAEISARRRTRRRSVSIREVCVKFDARDDDGGGGDETPRTGLAIADTPGSDWGGMSPGELGGSQYVVSPARSQSGSDLEYDDNEEKERERLQVLSDATRRADDAEAKKKRKLYPIFCPGRKTVHLVRHGQSTWNAANAGPGSWNEPQMFDAMLTELGKKQAKALGPELSKIPRDALWVSSPLTRALETCLIGRRAGLEHKASRLRKLAKDGESPDENADDINTPSGTSAKDFDPEKEFNDWTKQVVVRHELTEKLNCTGDIGRPTHCLSEDFPQLSLALSRIPDDRWWWDCDRKPNDAQARQFNSHEPAKHFKQRVEKFRSWLLNRPEKTFVIFGHSEFFKEFSGNHRSMKNCEIHEMRL